MQTPPPTAIKQPTQAGKSSCYCSHVGGGGRSLISTPYCLLMNFITCIEANRQLPPAMKRPPTETASSAELAGRFSSVIVNSNDLNELDLANLNGI